MTLNLDVKDKKILLALDMNARKTDSSIAKIVGISKQLTNYRIKRLEQRKIIVSYYPIIDHTKLGLQLYRIALKFENLTKEKEEQIINYLKQYASWMVSSLGNWDMWIAIYAKNEFELMKFWDTFYETHGIYIEDRWISLMTRFVNLERSFIYPEKKNRERKICIGNNLQIFNLDSIDKEILSQLSKNARQTSLELAKKINQTERITRYRIKKLEKQSIILGYRTFVDMSILNWKYYKLFIQLKETKKQELLKIETYISQNPYIIYNTKALGGYDLEIEAHFHDSQELTQFISKLRENFPSNIRSVSHLEYIKEHKITYFPSTNI